MKTISIQSLLYLLLALVAGLGGCSRCGDHHDDPGPQHGRSKLFVISKGPTQSLFVAREDTSSINRPYPQNTLRSITDTGAHYFYTGYVTFSPSDTTWHRYVWHFDNGESREGRDQTFLFQGPYNNADDSLAIVARLSVYGTDSADSATATKTIWLYKVDKIPYLGTYEGKFSDGLQGQVFFTMRMPEGEWNIRGFFEHFCPNLPDHQSCQRVTPSWIVFDQLNDSPIRTITNCYITTTPSFFGYYHFTKDSVYANVETYNQRLFRLSFKGKKI